MTDTQTGMTDCPECNMPDDSVGFPHYAHCSKASNEQKWPTDACERVKELEDEIKDCKHDIEKLMDIANGYINGSEFQAIEQENYTLKDALREIYLISENTADNRTINLIRINRFAKHVFSRKERKEIKQALKTEED